MSPAPLTSTITVRARGTATPATAWHRYTTPDEWPHWSPQIRSVQVDDPSRQVEAGDTGRVLGPSGVSARFAVTDVDAAAQRWTWVVHLGPLRLVLDHGVTADVRGSQAWARVRGPLPVVLAYAPLARLALTRLVSARIRP